MSWDEGSERTIRATPQRRAEARRQGRIPYSPELHTALTWGAVALLLMWQGPSLVSACGQWLRQSLENEPVLRAEELTVATVAEGTLLVAVVGLLASFWIMSIVLHWLQTGPVWTPAIAQPLAERVSPLRGLGRLLSGSSWVSGGQWLLRCAAICGLILLMLSSRAGTLANLPLESPGRMAAIVGEMLVTFVLWLCGLMLALAAIDFGWRWWQHERSLRMTIDEWRSDQRDGQQRRRAFAPSRHRNTQRTGIPQTISSRPVNRV